MLAPGRCLENLRVHEDTIFVLNMVQTKALPLNWAYENGNIIH
jgi:hypothetical protein